MIYSTRVSVLFFYFFFFASHLNLECFAGSRGVNCAEDCAKGFYGRLCREECSCDPCDKVYGCQNMSSGYKYSTTAGIEIPKYYLT